MYFVVLWEGWSATIPASWLMLESKSFKWPASNKVRNPTLECIKKTLPNDDWDNIYYKKYFGPFGTYEEGRNFEREMIYVSTNDEETLENITNDMNNNASQKRKVKKPSRYCTSSDEEDEKLCNQKKKIRQSSKKKALTEDELNDLCVPKPPTTYNSALVQNEKGNSI
ncbi:unnamed protein product [Lasius platythorax]